MLRTEIMKVGAPLNAEGNIIIGNCKCKMEIDSRARTLYLIN